MYKILYKKRGGRKNTQQERKVDVNERLNILRQSGIISERTLVEVVTIDRECFDGGLIQATDENSTMFLVHLAMTIERVHQGEPIDEVDEGIREEVMRRPETEKNRALVRRMEEIIGEKMTEEECIYLLIHLGTWKEKEDK